MQGTVNFSWHLDVHGEKVSVTCVNLAWLKAEERLTASLLVFVRGIDVLKVLNCLFKQLAHCSDVLYRAMTTLQLALCVGAGSVLLASAEPRFVRQTARW